MAAAPPRILIVDDERGIRLMCGEALGRVGYRVDAAETAAAGLAAAAAADYDLVLCDLHLPDGDGLSVLAALRGRPRPPTVLLITAFPTVETAVRGMKLGARDYLSKPFSPDELRLQVARALDEDRLRDENQQLRRELAYGNLIGRSAAMRALQDTLEKVARADANVLVTGESGTGKELVARAVHFCGARAAQPFVAVNCGALVESLLESELFGHVRGAFTGADRAKRGLFVAAHGGTLFLDEVGELPLPLQPKLLRALQDGEIKPVGGLDSTRVDARVVAATNRALEPEMRAGRFREDLFYRLHVVAIEVPPLRERREDIPLLVDHFVERAALRARRSRPELTPAALEHLAAQSWPGNVRELENAIERAVVLATGELLDVADFAPRARAAVAPAAADELVTLEELERQHVQRVLAACAGQKTRAAALLGINRTTLWKKLRAYGLE